jgi:hypothetical protein
MIIVGENTYISVSEADTLLQYELEYENWLSKTENEKERALVLATRNIDDNIFNGQKYDLEQKLEFPRDFLTRKNGDNTYGEIPNNIKLACALEALAILENGSNIKSDRGIKNKLFAGLSVTYTDSYANSNNNMISDGAYKLIKPYLKRIFNRGYYG